MSNLSIDADVPQSNFDPTTTDENRNNTNDEFDMINTRVFPWIKIVIKIFNNINLKFDNQIKSCNNLFKALLNMYKLSSSYSRSSSIQTHLSLNKNQQVKKCFFKDFENIFCIFLVFNYLFIR